MGQGQRAGAARIIKPLRSLSRQAHQRRSSATWVAQAPAVRAVMALIAGIMAQRLGLRLAALKPGWDQAPARAARAGRLPLVCRLVAATMVARAVISRRLPLRAVVPQEDQMVPGVLVEPGVAEQ